ncbi:MAG: hypothetical protein HFG20_06080 [Anaerotruncus sp.]|nr:hypothetical protein [Anaerotruncus sp.]
MKTIFRIALALAMVLVMSCVAFAAEPDYMDKDEIETMIDQLAVFTGSASRVQIGQFARDGDGEELSYDGDRVRSDEDFYVAIPPLQDNPIFADKSCFKVKFEKEDNGARIRYALITEKIFGENTGRKVAFRFILAEDYTDEEFKVTGTAIFTAKKDIGVIYDKNNQYQDSLELPDGHVVMHGFEVYQEGKEYNAVIKKGTKLKIPISFWVKNEKIDGDYDDMAGNGGTVVKPTKNEEHEAIWEDENNTLAAVRMNADSDVKVYYPKLSTRWYPQLPFTEAFSNQDAFIYNFMGNPVLSSTSRATLELRNPYVDDEGELTLAPEDVIIYQVKNGQLTDVSEQFTATENEEGEPVFSIRTRELGIYVFAEQAIG